MTPRLEFTGSYDSIDLPAASYEEVLEKVRSMPIPDSLPEEKCPPQIGFDEADFAISRNTDGSYFLYPADKNIDADKVHEPLKAAWNSIVKKSEGSESETKFCLYCGEKIKKEARFCSKCGKEQ